jgi:hypothetical protein
VDFSRFLGCTKHCLQPRGSLLPLRVHCGQLKEKSRGKEKEEPGIKTLFAFFDSAVISFAVTV